MPRKGPAMIAKGPRARTQFDLIIIIQSHQFKTYMLGVKSPNTIGRTMDYNAEKMISCEIKIYRSDTTRNKLRISISQSKKREEKKNTHTQTVYQNKIIFFYLYEE